jgi:hypothetical protein
VIVESRTITPAVRPAAGATRMPCTQLLLMSTRLTITFGSDAVGAIWIPAPALFEICVFSIRTLRAPSTRMPLVPR